MRVAVQKLNGVEGVKVSLKEGVAVVRFRADTRATVAQAARAVRENGVTPKDAQVRIRGRVEKRAGRLVLVVPGLAGTYPLHGGAEGAASIDRLREALHGSVEIVGRVSERASGGDASPTIEVFEISLRPAGSG